MEGIVLLKKSDLFEVVDEAINKALSKNEPDNLNSRKVLSLDEAVAYLNDSGFPIAKSSLYRFTAANQIPFRRFGERRIVFQVDELREWVNEQLNRKISSGKTIERAVASSARRKLG